MIILVAIAEFIIAIITFANKFQTRLTLQDQLPKLGKMILKEIYFQI